MRLSPRVTVAALASVALLAAAGCSSTSNSGSNGEATPSPSTSETSANAGGNGGNGGNGGSSNADPCKVEPPAGTNAGQCDTLPMPKIGNVYNNPQPRSNIKDGGTLTTAISSAGPQWNRVHVDGNSLDTGTIMSYMEPVLWDYTADGQAKPNKNYLTSYKITSKNPMVVKFEINPKAKWNNGQPIDWTAFKTTWETQNGVDMKKYPAAITDGYSSIKSVTKGKSAKEAVVTFKTPFYPVEFLFNFLENPKNSDPTFLMKGWINNLNRLLGGGPFTLSC
jgi:peptide/nickel transport system substrate-binding protein